MIRSIIGIIVVLFLIGSDILLQRKKISKYQYLIQITIILTLYIAYNICLCLGWIPESE